jgi:sulfide:quinone oxidoreductase
MSARTPPLGVVVAGGGVAALELVLALNDLAADRVVITVVAPDVDFVYRPPSSADPSRLGYVERYPLRRLADDLGARLVPDALARVSSAGHEVVTSSGEVLRYERLVLAVGARPYPAFRHAVTLGVEETAAALTRLVSDLNRGDVRRVAFVVPSGATWTLPLYELAIMTARHGWAIGLDHTQYWFVTPEPEPLAICGARASRAVHAMLEPEAITFIGSTHAEVREGAVLLDRGRERIEADRIVCLPLLDGPQTPGVPTDVAGFIPVDADCRLPGVPDVYAAGDATSFPIKQGGLACQQADAVAESIAAAAGAPIEPSRFRPVLRGKLMTAGRDRFLRRGLVGAEDAGEVSEQPLWWPPSKIAGRYLAPYLLARHELDRHAAPRSEPHVTIEAPAPPPRRPRASGSADHGLTLLIVFTASALLIVALVVVAGAVGQMWILTPIMIIDFAVTAAVLMTVAKLLEDADV